MPTRSEKPRRRISTALRLASSIASCIARPARTARSGSSSCAVGRPEHAHHVVADELVDRAPKRSICLAEAREGAVDERLDRLRVHPLGRGRVAGEIGEQDCRLASLLRRSLRRRGCRWGRGGGARRRCRCRTPCRTSAPPGFSAPQLGAQRRVSSAPQDMQNRACSGFSAAQLGQALPSIDLRIGPRTRLAAKDLALRCGAAGEQEP